MIRHLKITGSEGSSHIESVCGQLINISHDSRFTNNIKESTCPNCKLVIADREIQMLKILISSLALERDSLLQESDERYKPQVTSERDTLEAQVNKLRAFAQELSIHRGLDLCHYFTKHELWDKIGSPTPLLTGEGEPR